VGTLGAASLALALLAGSASAVTYDLVADEVSRTFNGTTVELWGFGLSGGGSVSVPGPVLEVPAGENLVVNLTNQLTVPLSVVVPGLGIGAAATPVLDGNGRVQSFSASEALPAGGTASYTFPAATKPGTYLYESGTDPALQIPMGLYGAVVVRPSSSGQAYDDLDGHSAFDAEQVLVLSEVDPALADAVEAGDFGTAAYPSTVNYAPRFFLINGDPFGAGQAAESIGTPGERTLLRLLNAGSLTYAPTLTAFYVQEIAQDGNLQRFPQERLTTLLHAGQTKDVVFANPPVGNYALYDRRLFVEGNSPGGMIKRFKVRTAVTFGCGLGPELSLVLLALLGLRRARRRHAAQLVAASLAGLAVALVAVDASGEGRPDPEALSPTALCIGSGARTAAEIRDRWGVEVVGIHLTAAGHMVDFRYRVLDPIKAGPLLDRQHHAELIDQASGEVLSVPHAAKIGTLRQNTANPRAGRVAYALFANPRKLVQPGRQVTIRIGNFKAENLTVQ
jgi:hypothetical protein